MIPNNTTPIKNDILIEIFAKGKLTRMEMRIVSYVMRWSWGFDGKKRRRDWTRSTMEKQIAEDLGVHKVVICRVIKQMIKRKILLTKKLTKGLCYQFNEHYKDWKKLTEKLTNRKLTEKSEKVNRNVNKKLTEKLIGDAGKQELADNSETLKERVKKTIKETKMENSHFNDSEIDGLIQIYKDTYPEHVQVYKLGGIIKMRDLIKLAISRGMPVKAIAERIVKAKVGTPWEIITDRWLNKNKKEKKNYDKLIKRFSN